MATAPLELEPASPEVKRYQRLKLSAGVVATVMSLAYLAILGFLVLPRLDLESLGGSRWLQILTVGVVVAVGLEILTLPISYWSGFVVEHRFGLSTQSLGGWIWKKVKGYIVGAILGLLLMSGLYGLIWSTGPYWWLWAAGGWLLLGLVMGHLVPVLILPLFYKVTRLDDVQLLERLRRIAEGTGLTVEGVYRLVLSKETRKANAALAGLGNTRRVLLGDTLLEQFTTEEIEVVFAHEVGHHVHRHLIKNVVLSVFFAGAGFWVVDRVLASISDQLGYAGIGDPRALPLILLVLSLFGLILSPLQNGISRFFERQCDRYALDRTGLRESYRSAFIKLARVNKSDPDPNPLVVWLFYSHPPIRQRVAMAG